MSKKSLDRKAAKLFIVSSRDNGRTDQEIYNKLTEQYFDKKSLAILITETITAELKKTYKVYNNILIGPIGLSFAYNIYKVVIITMESRELWVLLFAIGFLFFAFYLIYEIWNYNKPIYKFCGIMTGLGFVQYMRKFENMEHVFICLIVAGGIVGLSFYLNYKLFPNYKPNSLKKDDNGDYILPN